LKKKQCHLDFSNCLPLGKSNSTRENRAASALFITLKDHNCQQVNSVQFFWKFETLNFTFEII